MFARFLCSLQVRRIQHDGYNVEQHRVITKDGYVLTLHRIPQVQLDANGTFYTVLRRPVVFLLSGLYASSDVCVCVADLPLDLVTDICSCPFAGGCSTDGRTHWPIYCGALATMCGWAIIAATSIAATICGSTRQIASSGTLAGTR